MRIKGLTITALAIGLTAGLASTASVAQELDNWIGASFGNADFNFNTLSGITPSSLDDSGTAGKIYLGIPFTKNVGLEIGYVSLGRAYTTGTIGTAAANSTLKSESIFNFDLMGSFNVTEKGSLFAKGGFYRWNTSVDTTIGGTYSAFSDNGWDFTYGVGGQYDLTKDLSVRLEWERFNSLGFSGTSGTTNPDLISVGVIYKFKIL